ncbi:MAG: PSD1 and planctomycete cytochrome C domain-containing protein [Planctomycetaceae bacterium]
MKSILHCTAVFGIALLIVNRSLADDAKRDVDHEKAERHFTLKVLPLLKSKCLACHGGNPKDIKGKYDLRTRQAALKGGESDEAAIVPGSPKKSPLFQAILWQDREMPPKENDRLTKVQIEIIRQWILDGAIWPGEARQKEIRKAEWSREKTDEGILVKTSGGLNDEWTYRRYQPDDLWAFQPLKKVTVPKVPGISHPIDAFIRTRLKLAGLSPASQADKLTLLRRATYDLHGLPPTPKQVQQFLSDKSPNAWKKLIDRLLASPAYGEKWAQHWLDVVRYADTAGFSNDWERSNAWRYRDYVIRSFNQDKSYRQFIMEQIAGDELDPDNPEMMIAVGFLRMGPWEHTPMLPEKVSRQQFLDDLTNAIGQTFLSLPLRCAKCHDHKFDPIPTRDYYRIYAALSTTHPAERRVPFLKSENLNRFKQGRQLVQLRLDRAKKDLAVINAKEEKAGREWARKRGIPYIPRTYKNNHIPEDKKPPRHIGLSYFDQGYFKVRRQDVRIWTRRLERYQPMAQSVFNGGYHVQQSVMLRTPEENKRVKISKSPPQIHILQGGDVHTPMDPVTPGVLSAVSFTGNSKPNSARWDLPKTMSGRRAALAKWIADPRNPLTTRSIVNRIWQYHFGTGLAANANNFGKTGSKPTHPELLDWLAARFIREGWSFKQMHRLIMTSQTYRQSSRYPDFKLLMEKDPSEKLLARFRPRRLTSEELRDSLLTVTGEMNWERGGLPIFPEINREVALAPRMLQSTLAPAYVPSRTPAERNRRSIYIYRSRGLADPFSEVFNKPNADESCERRDSSTVTPQVFMLMNSDRMTKRSLAFALRLQKECKTVPAQIERAFRLAFGRSATAREQAILQRYRNKMVAYHRTKQPKPETFPLKITRSVVEEMSGLAFDYTELLDGYKNYVPDPDPAKQSAETRALADVCQVLLNTNEFLYVY